MQMFSHAGTQNIVACKGIIRTISSYCCCDAITPWATYGELLLGRPFI